jgi:hypothetical protein
MPNYTGAGRNGSGRMYYKQPGGHIAQAVARPGDDNHFYRNVAAHRTPLNAAE